MPLRNSSSRQRNSNRNKTSKNRKIPSRSEINNILTKLNKDVIDGRNFSKYQKYLETNDNKSNPYYDTLKKQILHYYQTDPKYKNMVDKFVSSSSRR